MTEYPLAQLSSMDVFFYYGEPGSDLDLETQSDALALFIQPKHSLFYNRREGCGISDKENYPNSFVLTVTARYDIMNAVAYRNANVTDGRNGTVDRRFAVSQDTVSFSSEADNVSVLIGYIPLANMTKPKRFIIPVKGA